MKKRFKRVVALLLSAVMLIGTGTIAFAQTADEATELSKKTAEQVEAEGLVMLKNEDDILPLKGKKVNVFGTASANPFYGGGGSGAINGDNATSFYSALEAAGINYNKELAKIYSNYAEKNSMNWSEIFSGGLMAMFVKLVGGQMSRIEMPVKDISCRTLRAAKKYSDTAIIFIGRAGLESEDLDESDLRLNDAEKAMVDYVTSNFKKCIVILNVSNAPELGWLDEYESIKAALYVGAPGEYGFNAVAKALTGEVNPSGRLTDTIAYNVSDHPSSQNFGSTSYLMSTEKFVEYQEGIYIGYRYFETFAPEKVQYPFGYGLSYTNFEWSDFKADIDKKGNVTVKVTVKNTGKCSGKDVVQVYFTPPYSADSGIEKAEKVLAGYAKTKELAPGESDTVTVSFDTYGMSSYDTAKGCYVLSAGSYRIFAAHDVKNEAVGMSRSFNLAGQDIKNDPATGTAIKNLFDYAAGDITYMSRADVEGTYPAPAERKSADIIKDSDKRPEPMTEGTVPTTGAVYEDGVITLQDVYRDESLWDKFLDQLTVSEMIELIGDCAYQSPANEKYGIPSTYDNDGTANVKGAGGFLYKDAGVAYPTETVCAQTWNDELIEKMGAAIGKEAVSLGTDYLYAPACNMHRSPMGGRNFEYYSEDPLLSGKMAAAFTRGAQSEKLLVTVKHFALNDQETARMGIHVWSNEQAIREIYCKPFEIAIKEGGAKGIMSAFNRIGTKWCGGTPELLVDLLRNEWGFDGMVITDAYTNLTGYGYMDPVLAVYARNNELLCMLWSVRKITLSPSMKLAYKNDPIGFGTALRDCTKGILKNKMLTKAFLETVEQ